MQCFLPYPDFEESAVCLKDQHLWKQVLEACEILKVLDSNHPAVKMWRGYRGALIEYAIVCCEEWIARGKDDSGYFESFMYEREIDPPMPPWLGDSQVHSSHRANLLRKDRKFYAKYGWTESPMKGYYWPVV